MGERKQSGGGMDRREFLEIGGSAAALAAAGVLSVGVGRAWPAESGKTIRMGVCGGGFGAHFWWHEHPNCVVTGVTDLRADRRATLQKNYRCETAYESLEEMVEKARDIDAVAIFSGAPDHARHVKMCMERGWHVVSACPSCCTLEEAAMLKEVKERTGRRYMLAESSYYRQDTIFARKLFEEGKFGDMFYSEVEYYHQGSYEVIRNQKSRYYMPDGSRSWRWGFPPMLYPTHSLGFLVGVTRERITKVSCLGYKCDFPTVKNSDNVYKNPYRSQSALMLTNRDHMCRCNVFFITSASVAERAQWFGTKATLYMTNPGVHGQMMTPGGRVKVPEYWKTDMLPPKMRRASGHGGSAVFISAEFVNALVEDREPVIDLYESLAMTVPGIVAHQSSFKDGEQLAVPQYDPAGRV